MSNCHCKYDACVLRGTQFSSGDLGPVRVCEVRGLLSQRRYSAGETVFCEGTPCTQLMMLRTGQLKLTTTSLAGREQILGLLVAGQLVSFETSDVTHPYTAKALTPAEVCCVTHKEMLRVLEENPPVALSVIQRIRDELIQARIMIRNLSIKPARARVASFILSIVPGGVNSDRTFPLVLSRLEVAELLGLSEETVSRVFAEFRRNSLIEAPHGKIRLLDAERVKRLAGVGRGEIWNG